MRPEKCTLLTHSPLRGLVLAPFPPADTTVSLACRDLSHQQPCPRWHRGPPSPAAHLKHFLVQDPGAEHNDAVDIYNGVVAAVEELRGPLFTVEDQGDVLLVDTERYSVPPVKEKTAGRLGPALPKPSSGSSLHTPRPREGACSLRFTSWKHNWGTVPATLRATRRATGLPQPRNPRLFGQGQFPDPHKLIATPEGASGPGIHSGRHQPLSQPSVEAGGRPWCRVTLA